MAHHDHDGDESDHRNAPSNHPQVAALGELGDYEVAKGYPDVRGWTVKLADGRDAGKVHELIVDTGAMRTRYLDVRLDGALAGAGGARDVLVPIGTARLDDRGDNVLVDNITADQLGAMPAYEHGSLTREHEMAVRRHFGATAGDDAATSATSAGDSTDFYAHQHFDDNSFYGDRAAGNATASGTSGSMGTSSSTSSVSSTSASAGGAGAMPTDGEVSIPVSREGAIARRNDGSSETRGTTSGTTSGSADRTDDRSTDSRA